MVGLGGGFILVPILRLFFGLAPADAAGTSLVLVMANSASGAFTYLMQQRVHVRTGLLFAAGGLPGGIIGAILALHISGQTFDWVFAVFLVAVAIDMIWNAEHRVAGRIENEQLRGRKAMSFEVCARRRLLRRPRFEPVRNRRRRDRRSDAALLLGSAGTRD